MINVDFFYICRPFCYDTTWICTFNVSIGWIIIVANAPDTPPMKKCKNDYFKDFYFFTYITYILIIC
jgi:cell division protein FtsX